MYVVQVESIWARLGELFRRYDKDGSGDLDLQEMALVLKVTRRHLFDDLNLLHCRYDLGGRIFLPQRAPGGLTSRYSVKWGRCVVLSCPLRPHA